MRPSPMLMQSGSTCTGHAASMMPSSLKTKVVQSQRMTLRQDLADPAERKPHVAEKSQMSSTETVSMQKAAMAGIR